MSNVSQLVTKTLPKTNVDKFLDGVASLAIPATTAILIRFFFRSNRG